MHGKRFDDLARWLHAVRSRRTVARLLGGGALAASLAGLGLFAEEGAAADKKKDEKKIKKWCHRGSDTSILGTTKKGTKTQRRKHLRKHPADYKGPCTAANVRTTPALVGPTPGPAPGPAPGPPPNPPNSGCRVSGCVAPLVCNTQTGQCVECLDFTHCDGGICAGDRCVGFEPCPVGDPDCANVLASDLEDLVCNEGGTHNPQVPADVCVLAADYFGECSDTSECPNLTSPPVGQTVCVLGQCVIDCREGGQADCDVHSTDLECVGGACLWTA